MPTAAIAAAVHPMMILVIRDFCFPFAQRKRTNSKAIWKGTHIFWCGRSILNDRLRFFSGFRGHLPVFGELSRIVEVVTWIEWTVDVNYVVGS